MKRKQYALGFAFSRDKESVVLIEKTKPDWQKGRLNGVGGKVEDGETPLDAMYREFEEETGVAIPRPCEDEDQVWNRWEHYTKLTFKEADVFVFRVFTNAVYQVKTTTEEKVDVYRVATIDDSIIPNLRYLIPMALDENIDFTDILHKI